MVKSPSNCNAIWKQFGGAHNPGTKLVPKFTDKTLRQKRANTTLDFTRMSHYN